MKYSGNSAEHWRLWRWVFLVLLGITGACEGNRVWGGADSIDRGCYVALAARLRFASPAATPGGMGISRGIALAWPLFMIMRHGYGALSLWTMHVSDRLMPQQGPGPFASEPWWEYVLGLLAQALPWTPLALAGAWRSLVRAWVHSKGNRCAISAAIPAMVVAGDRLLCVWAFVPLGLLALAPVKNAHYAISTQVPWSIWAALALANLGTRLRLRGYNHDALIRAGRTGFAALALTYGLGLWLFEPMV